MMTGTSSLIPLRSSSASSGGAARAVSPYGSAPASGIPTPSGRSGIPSSRSQTLADKQSHRTSAGSTTSTSSSKSANASSTGANATASSSSSSAPAGSKPPASAQKNSMLDKFKFFKDKDK
ncbi:hypothetical protein EGW08_011496, partial [Elysia chlorotica]